ncbi:uncharacterized protein LOC133300784 [Gastrolobium bilobum]|uniref:uncharacterized protein LOC133300784 n=1 Tax=Gastrolobium bilobum TaxID=150636 RepID=UPI002AB24D1E|nr:uncharacterized protein LOC133300784 [Gastrolobium bilobum]
MYLLLFTIGLQSGGIANSLAKKSPVTKEDLLERIKKYIDLEEFTSSQKQIEQGFQEASQSRRPEKPAGRGKFEERRPRLVGERFRFPYQREFTPLNTPRAQILKEVMSAEMRNVSRPPPLQPKFPDKTRWCEFHQGYVDVGNEDKSRRPYRSRSPPGGRGQEAGKIPQQKQTAPNPVQLGHVCTIARGRAGGGESSNARKKHLKMCMAISDKPRFKEERRKTGKKIVFEDLDDEIIDPEHDDPLVISGLLANYRVDRTLVDVWSSVDIIFLDAFRRMDLDYDQLEPYGAELLAFTGDKIKPLRYIPLRMTLGKAPAHKTVT